MGTTSNRLDALRAHLYNSQVPCSVFISYHEGDKLEVENFIKTFGPEGDNVFIPKVVGLLGQGDFVNSSDPEYIMRQIRSKYLSDSTVTIVLIGSCTHSRRYVDWELKASLRQENNSLPNGVLGIFLPSVKGLAHLPQRLTDNWKSEDINCYARVRTYPKTVEDLRGYIEDASKARTSRAHLIANSQEMMKHNAKCKVHDKTCNSSDDTIRVNPALDDWLKKKS